MQQGQRAKLIDAKATFPEVGRDAPEAPALRASAPEGDVPPAEPAASGGGLAGWLGLPVSRPAPVSADAAAEQARRDQAMGR